MLLRVRFTLIITATLVVFALIAGSAALVVLRQEERRSSAQLLEAQTALWGKSLNDSADRLGRDLQQTAADNELVAAAARHDRGLLAARLGPLLERGFHRVDASEAGGEMDWSSSPHPDAKPLVETSRVLRAVAEGGGDASFVSVERGDDGKPVVAVSTPFGAGLLTGTMDIASAVTDIARTTGTLGLIVVGEQPAAMSEVRAAQLVPGLVPNCAPCVETASQAGRHWRLVVTPLLDSGDQQVGRLIVARDATLEVERRQLVIAATIAAAVLALVSVMVIVYGRLRRDLGPLEDATEAVNALAHGDTLVTLDLPERRDEIGRIAEAVRVFRENVVQLERVGYRRERERDKNERLIRRQMLALADTLGPEAKLETMRDLERIEQELHESGQGESDTVLAIAFRQMSTRVQQQHERLSAVLEERTRDLELVKTALAEREQLTRLRQELNVARDMQMASLPAIAPPFDGHPAFELAASMVPAKDVGGDFYDFFFADEKRLALAIGDASGKGVSAAMFVTMGRSLLRSAGLRDASPGPCLGVANAALAADNPTSMFVTAQMFLVDLESGEVVASNAGHNPPFLLRADGTIEMLRTVSGPALGAIDEWEYKSYRVQLAPGDTLLLYTDGLPEAQNEAGELFTEERMQVVVAEAGRQPKELVRALDRGVGAFVGEAAQFDDMTMLCFHWRGSALG
jgi:phosphoserine phosphatase RsbU/P